MAPNQPASQTHPGTRERIKVVEDFLSGTPNVIVDIFRNSLARLSKPALAPIYDVVDVRTEFDDLRTFSPSRIESAHGLFDSAWRYMFDTIDAEGNPWQLDVALKARSRQSSTIWQKNPFATLQLRWLGMEILTRNRLEERLKENDDSRIVIDPVLDPSQLGEITFDLRLGPDFLVSLMTRRPSIDLGVAPNSMGKNHVRGIESYFRSTRREFSDKFILYPNQVVLATYLEYVALPSDVFADILTRSSFNRLGISLSTMIQPGYRGCITLELFNHGNNPVEMVIGSRVVQARFFQISAVGQYQKAGVVRKYYGNVRPVVSKAQLDAELTRFASIRGTSPSSIWTRRYGARTIIL
jgi:dCTP deaminase